jgi:DNA-binding response OmpR family regulator
LPLSLKRVLVVDDDSDTCALIVDILEEDGYELYQCTDSVHALEILSRERFDLILADIKMPEVTGIDLLLHVRRMDLDAKVILMTAYASLHTAIQALRGEAFDYLIKPFSLNELRQRVRQAFQCEMTAGRHGTVMRHKDLTVDLDARRVWIQEREISLSLKEFDVLAYLCQNKGRVVPNQEMLRRVWAYDEPSTVNVDTVRTCIRRLRKKLGDSARSPHYIFNKWGAGYYLGE